MVRLRKGEGRAVPVQQQPDQDLISRCQAGDLDAFGEIYARYERAVHRFAYHMLGDPDDADDVTQDAFMKAYRTLPGFRGECSLLTWLLKVTGNLCRDRHKMRARRGEIPLPAEHQPDLPARGERGGDPAALFERKDLHATLYRVLGGLPEAQRELIALRDLEGLSYQEIAEVLGCSAASVKLRLFRARRSFRDRMEAVLQFRKR